MWSRMKPRKMYASLFLYSSIAVCLLTLVFTMYLSRLFVQSAMEEIHASNQDKLQQAVQTSEFTLQKLRQFALRVYSEENIALWLNMNQDDYSPLTLYKAATSVREFVSSEPFIQSICMFNFNINQIYSSSETSLYTPQDFYDPSMLHAIKNKGTTPYLQFFDHGVQGESYLALIVPAVDQNRNYSGYVSILFSKPLLNEHMLQISEDDPNNKMIVEGPNEAFMLGNADAELASELANADKPASVSASWEWASGEGTWSVQTASLPVEGWRVYQLSLYSSWQAQIDRIRVDIIASSVVLVLALLLFLFWQSYRRLKPISDLTARLQSKLGSKETISDPKNAGSEIDWLDFGFDRLVDRLEQQDLSLKSSKALIKDDLIRQWIHSSQASGSGPVERFIREQTAILRTGLFRIAVIRLESYGRFTEYYDFTSRKLLRYALGNMMTEVLNNHGFAAETVDFGSDHIVALISASASGEEEARILDALKDVRFQIRRWLKLELQAAVSSVLGAGAELQPAYEHVYELTLLGFLCDEDRVFTMADLDRYRPGEGNEPDERLLTQAIHAVRLGDAAALEADLDSLTRQMHGLSYDECKLQLTHIIYSIMKSFKNGKTFQGMKSIHVFLDRFSTLGEVKTWLLQELLQMMNRQRQHSGSARKEECFAEMMAYVRIHLHDPMLSVEDVAEHVNISVNYARQIFKAHHPQSLSDYITDQRIKYAMNLLTTTDWTIADITEQSGFQTKSTFFSLFKRATGITPGQYRLEKAKK
ncbi:helix-turn-helix domain-containing protein [Paenibacillus sacheonensis]|uniref:Helix-turn-helix domain-containing protein n=1 Tax=Paenibacillus sacheonensis TaxID=742054 RepID=A0A7X4YWB5_9BACL|nr:helix-turn-helix domain-containing protein [Paenibacillus sacheonensis]MBM7569033.1 AraC-like DNA-binding protein [Paenibacillus sacheonensis]NBC72786.1 helix-turn-helix domain-containing protein [Paenibacillus sacheonensis]